MYHQGKPGQPSRSLETSPNQVARSGFKSQCPQIKFCADETEYLGHILTRTGIKPQPNKVQAVLAITTPKSVKDLRSFLGMVQYYQDLWARRSQMLAPLTSLVGECGHTKVTKANKTKKRAWYWDEVHQVAFDNVKATIARDVCLAYPDYSKEFENTLTCHPNNLVQLLLRVIDQ